MFKESYWNYLQKFSYETRNSARLFCEFLTKKREIDWEICRKNDRKIADKEKKSNVNENENGLCKYLVDQVEFSDAWKQDPTVDGMVRMIGAIYQQWKKYGMFPDPGKITFRFFDLGQFGLSDSLYTQMNARGWPLTAFESVKAALDKQAEQCQSKEWLEQWHQNIDGKWTKWFWKQYSDVGRNYNPVVERVDKPLLRIIARAAALFALENAEKTQKKGHEIQDIFGPLLTLSGGESFVPCSLFADALSISDNVGHMSCKDGLEFLDRFLHFIVDEESMAELAIQPSWKKVILRDFLSEENRLLYKRTLILYAAFKCQEPKWMRVVWNIVENGDIDHIERFMGAFGLITELSAHAASIEEYLASDIAVRSKFAEEQMAEERLKARLICNQNDGDAWRTSIQEAESHPLLRGNLSALLYTQDTPKSFSERMVAFKKLFPEGNQEVKQFARICLAMLKLGDCSQAQKGHWRFPTCQSAFDSIFHLRSGQDSFRGVLRELLSIVAQGGDIEDVDYRGNRENSMDWRWYFCHYPQVFIFDDNNNGFHGFYHWDDNIHMPMWQMTSDNLHASHRNPFLFAISVGQDKLGWRSSRAGDGLLHIDGTRLCIGVCQGGFSIKGGQISQLEAIEGLDKEEVLQDADGGVRLITKNDVDLIAFGREMLDKLHRSIQS